LGAIFLGGRMDEACAPYRTQSAGGQEERFPPRRLSGDYGFRKRSLLPMIRAM
jgi:hypothetical protein